MTVRVEKDLRDAANAKLFEHDWEMALFIESCLKAVVEEPDKVLRLIGRHRAVRRPRGRPPVTPSE